MNKEMLNKIKGTLDILIPPMFFLILLIVLILLNDSTNKDYIRLMNTDNKVFNIETPYEYYNIDDDNMRYEYRYNDELDTVDLVIHFKLKE